MALALSCIWPRAARAIDCSASARPCHKASPCRPNSTAAERAFRAPVAWSPARDWAAASRNSASASSPPVMALARVGQRAACRSCGGFRVAAVQQRRRQGARRARLRRGVAELVGQGLHGLGVGQCGVVVAAGPQAVRARVEHRQSFAGRQVGLGECRGGHGDGLLMPAGPGQCGGPCHARRRGGGGRLILLRRLRHAALDLPIADAAGAAPLRTVPACGVPVNRASVRMKTIARAASSAGAALQAAAQTTANQPRCRSSAASA